MFRCLYLLLLPPEDKKQSAEGKFWRENETYVHWSMVISKNGEKEGWLI